MRRGPLPFVQQRLPALACNSKEDGFPMPRTRQKRNQKAADSSINRTSDARRQLTRMIPFLLPVTLPDGTKIMLLPDVHLALETRSAGESRSKSIS